MQKVGFPALRGAGAARLGTLESIVSPRVCKGFGVIRDVSEMWNISWESRDDLFEIPEVPLICCMPRNLDFPMGF